MSNTHNHNEGLTSLNKAISSSGFCSRREADKYIEQGRVTVNNKLAKVGMRVNDTDTIEIDGEPIRSKKKKKQQQTLYIAFNKPVGITSTTDLKDKTNIISYINHSKRIFPVGRLDKDSDGLIFLTNDGDIVNKILRAGNQHEKEYIVTVDKAITDDFVQQMSNGVPILNQVTLNCFVRKEGSRKFRIILTQGLNRQIRRMCEHLGYKVKSLTRVRIMNVELGSLPVGKWRLLTHQEVEGLNLMVATSSKVQTEPSIKAKSKKKKSTQPLKPEIPTKAKEQPNKSKRKSYKEFRKKR